MPIVLFGNGWGTNAALYSSNLFGQNTFYAIDNEWVTILAQAGLVGAVLLAALFPLVMLRGRTAYVPLLIAVLAMFFSFDVLLWAAPALVVGLIVSEESRRKSTTRLPSPTH
ncbi:hypothetical protein GCM10027414_36530 [Humibacter ginsengiterrae]